MKKCILIIGMRQACYQSALELGYQVVLWSHEKVHQSRKAKLTAVIEEPFLENATGLTDATLDQLRRYSIDYVIGCTEKSVALGALVRKALQLAPIAVDVGERFHNKLLMKKLAHSFGIPITRYMLIEHSTKAEDLIEELGFPVVVKPVDESGARDVQVAYDLSQLKKIAKPGLLAEAFVTGSEMSVETFIQNGRPIFHNCTEYLHQWRKSVAPASLDPKIEQKVLDLNDKIIADFGVDRGMTHAEFYLTEQGVVFGEIAIRPPGGYYMNLIEKVYQFDPWKVFIQVSCGEDVTEMKSESQGHACVYTVYPETGIISSIEGVKLVEEQLKDIFKFKLKKKLGDFVPPHATTSNEVGHVLFWNETRDALDTDLKFLETNLKVEVRPAASTL